MTVKQLMEMLAKQDPNARVILETNSRSLESKANDVYTDYDGTVIITEYENEEKTVGA